MTDAGLRFEPYHWRGGREWLLIRGPGDGPQIIIIPPLFEEMNFTRTFLSDFARALAERGIATWLPDLPGAGESLADLADMSWEDWRAAAAAIGAHVWKRTGARPVVAAFRGGSLLADAVVGSPIWADAPVDGRALLRLLRRAQVIADRESGTQDIDNEEIEYLAGYRLSRAMVSGLESASPAGIGAIAPTSDGAPLWRRAEPGRDRDRSAVLAADLAYWIAICEQS